MKVVLDTNVLINGLRDEYSYEKRIIDEVIEGGIEAHANYQTLQENKLIARQLIDSPEYEQVLNEYYGQVVPVRNFKYVRVVRDEEDNKILSSALGAEADYLITTDNDLLILQEYDGVKIVNPQEFWAHYKDEGEDLWKQYTNYVTKK